MKRDKARGVVLIEDKPKRSKADYFWYIVGAILFFGGIGYGLGLWPLGILLFIFGCITDISHNAFTDLQRGSEVIPLPIYWILATLILILGLAAGGLATFGAIYAMIEGIGMTGGALR